MLVEKRAHVVGKFSVVGLSGGVQSGSGLFIGASYGSPADCAGCNEWRQLILAARDGDGLLVGATVCGRYLAAPFGSQPRS